ncbi:F5/8 type C domain containing protein [Trichomonas vaginalis G3]|uniref:F5/8 type C domain containing protein n=1 Tax=Trichomonas vaginalis (strain ATCC PRA-98 / G3) TaxID=412133 RepID=A2DBM1_TRIV3|nr:bifunctional inhibitor/lipid-transfer protein/seed storage 2s albumin superfamily protein family [Trichomonas vaginalis G3]EAY22224.1 F5/8 type C domain containing protein [Trichomonas vaginalis G3]KAI5533318.1 bifunctional inhibitor/lipid-transfer protein/seed storage 2s albumin superfamily protein family [Trichomonas vaginalis G3]|eukprot:XP_001583210.1 F5/8 type C domain containing protein [Trichomonas vaginalis G3]
MFYYPAELEFDSEECYRQIKVSVTCANKNKVTAARIEFWRDDPVVTQAKRLFSDATWSDFSAEFQDPAKVQEFISNVNNHPCPYIFSEFMTAVNEILADPEGIKNSVQTIECRPTMGAYFNFDHNTNQPTGKYMITGERIIVYCENYGRKSNSKLVFSKNAQDGDNMMQYVDLPQGKTNTSATYTWGGLYAPMLWNCYSNEDFPPPKCRISGGHELLSFKLGDNATLFEERLENYLKDPNYLSNTLSNDVQGKLMNVAEVSGPNFVMHTTAGACLTGIRWGKNAGLDLNVAMAQWNEIRDLYLEYLGYVDDDPNPVHKKQYGTRVVSKIGKTGAYAYKTGNHIFYNQDYFGAAACNAQFIRASGDNWGAWHENGHAYDFGPTEEAELTNNMFPLMMQRRYNLTSRLESESRWNNVLNYLNYGQAWGGENWYGLGILRQLEIFAGKHSFAQFCRLIREHDYSGVSRREKFVIGFSKLVGQNLAIPLNKTKLYKCYANCMTYVQDLPPCDVHIEYLMDRNDYDRKDFPPTAIPKVLATYILDDGRLRMIVDFENGGSWKNMAGVEVRDEDENFIWFWHTVDLYIPANQWEPGKTFKIRGFGLNMNMTQPITYSVPSGYHRSAFEFTAELFPSKAKVSSQANSALSGMLDDDDSTCLYTDPFEPKELTGLIVDVGMPRDLFGIRWAQTRSDFGKTKHFTIHTSLDKEEWTELYAYHSNLTFLYNDNAGYYLLFPHVVTARYVKITQYDEKKRTSSINLCQFHFLERDFDPTPVATMETTPFETAYETPGETAHLTPYETVYQTMHQTAHETPYETPYGSPFITEEATVYQTPYMTEAETAYKTPFVTVYQTPYLTEYETFAQTPHNTAFETPYITEQQTAGETPFETAFQTPGISKFQTAAETPFNTVIETPHITDFATAAETPFESAFVTPFITPFITEFQTAAETAVETVFETPFSSAFETPYETQFITAFETPHDTPFSSAFETPYDTPFSSAFETPYDTPFSSAFETAVETVSFTPKETMTQAPIPVIQTDEPSISTSLDNENNTSDNSLDKKDSKLQAAKIPIIIGIVAGVIALVVIDVVIGVIYHKKSPHRNYQEEKSQDFDEPGSIVDDQPPANIQDSIEELFI